MPDQVVLEALRSADGKCFHYTFTGFNDPNPQLTGQLARMYFPGNRVTLNAAQVALVLPADAAKWRQVVDYNVAPFPPPAWPGSGSIPAMAESDEQPANHQRRRRAASHERPPTGEPA